MKYVETYSYTGVVSSGGEEVIVEISGFNVTKELTKASLATNFREPLTLYPCWNIELYLDQKQPYANYTYPSGVYGLYVRIWADSGEVFSCTPLAVGGLIPTGESTSPPSNQGESNTGQPLDVNMLAAIAVVVIIGAVIMTAIAYKKRSR